MLPNLRPQNPYYDHDAVRDPSMFFGREDELGMLYNAIDKRQCCSIVGPRHIGKSSLLKYLGDPEIQQRYGYDLHDRLFISTDWREYLQKTREDFFRAVCDRLIAQRQDLAALPLDSFRWEDRFRKLLEGIRGAGLRPVLLMDAFDKVTRNPHFDPDFFSFLRSLAGIYDLISYITASIKPLYEVCHSDAVASSPFFNIFQTCRLGPLTVEEAQQLITLPAHRAGCDFSAEEVNWVMTQAGRHPFFAQVACRHLFDEKLRQSNGKVDLRRVQERIYQDLLPHFDHAWSDLNEDQKKEIKLEASQNAHSRRKLPELSESWLFRKRIREIAQVEMPALTVEEVREALNHLDDTDFLETCGLSKMHYILRRTGNSTTPSPTKKGTLVQDFLRAAFERLRPSGLRSDSAPEWRLYNILWYHYFKYRLANAQTAARLSLSTRQFYRELEKAIQSLLKELLDLEVEAINEAEA